VLEVVSLAGPHGTFMKVTRGVPTQQWRGLHITGGHHFVGSIFLSAECTRAPIRDNGIPHPKPMRDNRSPIIPTISKKLTVYPEDGQDAAPRPHLAPGAPWRAD